MQNGNDEEAVRARLNEIARRHGQGEIARRTGCPGSSVSRYLKSNRIPVSFVASVAREFGANPAWLLSGEGVPWLADVGQEEARMGGKLLELVQSMGHVSRLKLGSLTGRGHAKGLRELNDALESFERVRAQLAAQTRDTYAGVLNDWQAAIRAEDYTAMRRLAQAADQVSRLCPDLELGKLHEANRASHEASLGNVEKALALRRRVFLSSIPDSGEIDDPALHAAFGVVLALDSIGHTREAVRFAEAALKLVDNPARLKTWGACVGTYGWLQIQSGRLRQGLGHVATALSHPMSDSMRDNLRCATAAGLYYTGGADLAGAAAFVRPAAHLLGRILFLSPWTEDAKQLGELLARHDRLEQHEFSGRETRSARAHLLSLQGRHTQALKEWGQAESDDEARRHNPVGLDFTLAVMRTQLLRRAGREADARDALKAAETARRACPANITLDLTWRRVHWRNTLALKTGGAMEKRAHKFAAMCRRRGIVFA